MDDDLAIQATSHEAYVVRPKSKQPAERARRGIQAMHFDTWISRGWDVMTHGLFLTYPHHDASGLLTFSYVRSGVKIWCYIDLEDIDQSDQAAVLKAWTEYYSQPMACESYNRGVRLGTLVLEEGGIM